MKKITLLLSFMACVGIMQAQLLVNENFDYPIGSDILSKGWVRHSGNVSPNDSILVTDGLTFEGYIASGIGGAANLVGSNKDQHKTFTAQTSGVVYSAFMMKAGSTNRPGYFFHLGPNPIGTTFFSRVWINATGTGMSIGTVSSGEPASYAPINPNTTYLIVVKSDLTTKVSSLFIFSTMPTTEPTVAQATYTETAMNSIGAIGLRQYTFTGSTTNQNVIVDGIRVATSWAALFTPTSVKNPSADLLEVKLSGKTLTVTNSLAQTVEIYSTLGAKVATLELINGATDLNLGKGLYIVRAGNKTAKIRL